MTDAPLPAWRTKSAGRARYRRPSHVVVLIGAALVMQAVYAGFFLARYPLTEFVDTPLLDLGKLGGYAPSTGAAVAAALGVLFACHAAAWWAARHLGRRVLPLVLVVSLVHQATLVWVYPIVAADVFNYVLQGRLAAIHGLNPLTAMPRDAATDPWLAFSAYPHIQLAYGPVWAALATVVAQDSRDSMLAGVLGFKALAVVANVANTALIMAIAQRLAERAVVAAAVAYAWSPLVLFETVANAHNDGLLAVPILVALWLVVRGGRGVVLAPAALMLAALIKYTPLVLLPVVLIGAWQALRVAGIRRVSLLLTGGMALAGALVVVAYLPYWVGPETLAGVRRQATETTTSVAAVLVKSGVLPSGQEDWLMAVRLGAGALLAALIVLRRPREAARTPASAFDLLLAQLMIGTFWFQPWYLVPLVAVAAASTSGWRGSVTLAFTVSATATYIVYFYLWTTPWWGTLSDLQVQMLATTVALGPPLAVLASEGWRLRQRRLRTAVPSPP